MIAMGFATRSGGRNFAQGASRFGLPLEGPGTLHGAPHAEVWRRFPPVAAVVSGKLIV